MINRVLASFFLLYSLTRFDTLAAEDSFLELERLYRAWEWHAARSQVIWGYPWSTKISEENREYWKTRRDEFVVTEGGQAYLKKVRALNEFKKNYLKIPSGPKLPNRALSPALLPTSALEELIRVPYPRDHLSMGPDGRIYFDRFDTRPDFPVKVESFDPLTQQISAFPNLKYQSQFIHTHSIRVDSKNRVWILDSGGQPEAISRSRPQIFCFDSKGNEILRYHFPPDVVPKSSLLNDFTIDEVHQLIFISDTSPAPFGDRPALVVFDFRNKSSLRLLENHISVRPTSYVTYVDALQGQAWKILGDLVTPKIGVDGIVYDTKRDYLYYAPNNAGRVYGLKAELIRMQFAQKISEVEIRDGVDLVAETTMTDGMAVDSNGFLYLSDPEHSAILRLNPTTGELETLFQDEEQIPFVSSLEFGPDGNLYFAAFPFHQIMIEKFNLFGDVKRLVESRQYSIYRLVVNH